MGACAGKPPGLDASAAAQGDAGATGGAGSRFHAELDSVKAHVKESAHHAKSTAEALASRLHGDFDKAKKHIERKMGHGMRGHADDDHEGGGVGPEDDAPVGVVHKNGRVSSGGLGGGMSGMRMADSRSRGNAFASRG